jgi:hypothetical protein
MVVGSVNDVAVTLLHCSSAVIPPAMGRWLPLVNEMANLAATSTGRRWIYEGPSKSLADGVALGAILGHSATAAVTYGPVTGALTLAANLGLTYWFPNKYFHTILVDLPQKIPDRYAHVKGFATSRAGRAVVGVSMIYLIEKILQKAEWLAATAPNSLNSASPSTGPAPAGADPGAAERKTRQSLALFLIEGCAFGDSTVSDPIRDRILRYMAGATREGGLFSLPLEPNSSCPRVLDPDTREKLIGCVGKVAREPGLVTREETRGMRERLVCAGR